MRGAIPPLPKYVFMAWCLVKHSDNFAFTFYPEKLVFIDSTYQLLSFISRMLTRDLIAIDIYFNYVKLIL